ncbi:MAG: cell division protein ZapA [Beijerinckiaceae bacterium]
MAQVTVTIDGKAYRMACDDGQEKHLEGLAAYFDGRVQEMRASFGEIGDMRLAVMAAITVTDEVCEMKKKLAAAEADIQAVRQTVAGFDQTQADHDRGIAEAITVLAERIERISRNLAAV